MQPLKKHIQTLRSEVEQAKAALDFAALEQELAALDERLNQPEIWHNPDEAQTLAKKAASVRQTVEPWQTLGVQLADIAELMELSSVRPTYCRYSPAWVMSTPLTKIGRAHV